MITSLVSAMVSVRRLSDIQEERQKFKAEVQVIVKGINVGRKEKRSEQ